MLEKAKTKKKQKKTLKQTIILLGLERKRGPPVLMPFGQKPFYPYDMETWRGMAGHGGAWRGNGWLARAGGTYLVLLLIAAYCGPSIRAGEGDLFSRCFSSRGPFCIWPQCINKLIYLLRASRSAVTTTEPKAGLPAKWFFFCFVWEFEIGRQNLYFC